MPCGLVAPLAQLAPGGHGLVLGPGAKGGHIETRWPWLKTNVQSNKVGVFTRKDWFATWAFK